MYKRDAILETLSKTGKQFPEKISQNLDYL